MNEFDKKSAQPILDNVQQTFCFKLEYCLVVNRHQFEQLIYNSSLFFFNFDIVFLNSSKPIAILQDVPKKLNCNWFYIHC